MHSLESLAKSPEVILIDILRNSLEFVRQDYINATDKSTTFLSKIFKQISLDNYDFTEQIASILSNDESNPRYLKIDLAYNMEKNNFPTAFLTLSEENFAHRENGIGLDQGYISTNEDGYEIFTRMTYCSYQFILMSDNSNEMIALYHLFKSIFLSVSPSMSVMGLMNFYLSGKDIVKYQTVSPSNVFSRAMQLNFQYEYSSLNIFKENLLQNVYFSGKPIGF